jgi:hypothetical protein
MDRKWWPMQARPDTEFIFWWRNLSARYQTGFSSQQVNPSVKSQGFQSSAVFVGVKKDVVFIQERWYNLFVLGEN